MKRVLLLAALPLALAACSGSEQTDAHLGYVEGLNSQIAPEISGRIVTLDVHEGEDVPKGASLFTIDASRAQAALDNAQAALQSGEAQLADLLAAGRPEEIRAARDAVSQVQAQAKLAQENFNRTQKLVDQGQMPKARLDADRAALDGANAALSQALARLALIKQPARADRIEAARAQITGLHAQVKRAQIDLADTEVIAPLAGRIQTVYRRVGELAGPSAPVLALLPPQQVRVRFFVGETELAQIKSGMAVHFSCDGCTGQLAGKVSYISSQAEFAPPMIFTVKERVRFKYMVEVMPDDPAKLHPGQPVDVTW